MKTFSVIVRVEFFEGFEIEDTDEESASYEAIDKMDEILRNKYSNFYSEFDPEISTYSVDEEEV